MDIYAAVVNEPSTAHRLLEPERERILFVDDEPEILDGLRRGMRAMRGSWDMEFAHSADEALAMLRTQRFDVVVADLWMPHMDGMELLAQVARLYPKVARIVLTGAVDRLTAARGRLVAQDYLVKPCSSEMLTSIIKVRLGIERLKRASESREVEPIGMRPPAESARSPLDVNDAIEHAVTISKLEWLDVADVTTDLEPGLRPIPCYSADLRLVLLNMIVNAAHSITQAAGPDGPKGWIRIRTRRHGLVTELQVADGATDIPDSSRAALFDASLAWDKGPGPWLAVAHDVVRKHGGTLALERLTGGGTAFTMLLPSA